MCCPRLRAGLAGLLLLLLASLARADEAAAWAALRSGSAIALVRHGLAPGVGDPPGWRLDDCSTQRNLNEAGRAEARALGERLRAEKIRVTRLLASPWCRCVETARLLGLAPPLQIDEAFANAYMLDDRRDELTRRGRAVLQGWRGPGVLVAVTHGQNIGLLTGYSPATGELVVVAGGEGGALRVVGVLPAAGTR